MSVILTYWEAWENLVNTNTNERVNVYWETPVQPLGGLEFNVTENSIVIDRKETSYNIDWFQDNTWLFWVSMWVRNTSETNIVTGYLQIQLLKNWISADSLDWTSWDINPNWWWRYLFGYFNLFALWQFDQNDTFSIRYVFNWNVLKTQNINITYTPKDISNYKLVAWEILWIYPWGSNIYDIYINTSNISSLPNNDYIKTDFSSEIETLQFQINSSGYSYSDLTPMNVWDNVDCTWLQVWDYYLWIWASFEFLWVWEFNWSFTVKIYDETLSFMFEKNIFLSTSNDTWLIVIPLYFNKDELRLLPNWKYWLWTNALRIELYSWNTYLTYTDIIIDNVPEFNKSEPWYIWYDSNIKRAYYTDIDWFPHILKQWQYYYSSWAWYELLDTNWDWNNDTVHYLHWYNWIENDAFTYTLLSSPSEKISVLNIWKKLDYIWTDKAWYTWIESEWEYRWTLNYIWQDWYKYCILNANNKFISFK